MAGYKQVVIEREKQIAERDDAIAGYKQVVIERDITAQNISIELAASKALIEEITNSTAWKLVQHLWGFRTSLLPHGSRREAIGKFSLHFFHSLASKATTSLWGLRKIAIRQVARNSKEIFDKPIKRMHNTAVILHLYYPDLWDEIKSYLLNLEGDFDLYISMPFNVKIKTKDVLSFHPETYIYRCKNQGRDIAPFLRIFNEISSLNYQYICKLHTKKTLSATIGNEWRKDLYNKLLGSSGIVRLVKKTFDENRPGLIAPCGHLLSTKNKLYMGNNEKKIRELSENAGIPYQGEDFLFVAGSMFWFSMEGLNPSMFTGIKQEDFEAEQGATDNALPHAIERFFGWVVHCSQKPVFISTGTNIHRLDSTNPATMPIYDWGK
ncbi:MAG: hypothetical protein DYH15_14880 [Nitrosomonas sp. PRO4]|nr:hypothetical protein [Nitrosomonas sp. PRO4]RIJ89071.1 MAG: hypothetical protein DCC43_15590 [Candidatus Brocadia sp.]